MEDVHHSQRWNRLCEWLYGPEAGGKTLPDVIGHIETLVVGIQQMQAQAEATQQAYPDGEIPTLAAENRRLLEALKDQMEDDPAVVENLEAENQLLRGRLQEMEARVQAADSYLEALDETEGLQRVDVEKQQLKQEVQGLRDALAEAQHAGVHAPAKHDLNDCAMAMFAQLDEGVQDWALEICRQDNIEPWQMVSGHLALAQERGELSSPVLDPGWMEQGQQFKRAYTCGGCGTTQEGRVGQKFCSNQCAKIVADRERPKEQVSDAAIERRAQGRASSMRTPIRREGAVV